MKRPVQSRRRSISIGMTPMVDVIFLLIIFFLCVNQYQKADSAEEVDLPAAKSEKARSPEPAPDAPMVINLHENGAAFVAGRQVTADRLAAALRHAQSETRITARGERAPLEVWIRADRRTPYRHVEPILQTCAAQGVWNVAFKVVTPEQKAIRSGE